MHFIKTIIVITMQTLYERATAHLQYEPTPGWHWLAEELVKELEVELQQPVLTQEMKDTYTSLRNQLNVGIEEVYKYI